MRSELPTRGVPGERAGNDPATTIPVYLWQGGHYQYNWSAKGLPAGLYAIYANLADGSHRSVEICLTK